jgi:nicotinate dehydrogenase subunit B
MTAVLDRRALLQASGALVVTFTLTAGLGQTPAAPRPKTVSPDEVEGFLAIAPDGRVTAYSGKVDLGTGLLTALTQIVADELDVPMNRVTIVQGDTALTPDQGPTYGSLSIQNGGVQLRRAAATARQALLRKAASTLDADISTLSLRDGIVTARNGREIPFEQLVGGGTLAIKIDPNAPEKPPSEYSLVGNSMDRLDIPEKVDGRFIYMQDQCCPNI